MADAGRVVCIRFRLGDVAFHEFADNLGRGLVLHAACLKEIVPEFALNPDMEPHVLSHETSVAVGYTDV